MVAAGLGRPALAKRAPQFAYVYRLCKCSIGILLPSMQMLNWHTYNVYANAQLDTPTVYADAP